MARRGNGKESRAQDPMAIILHDSTGWGPKDHEVLRDYLESHRLLPDRPHELPEEEIEAMARQVLDPESSVETRKRILVTLAHHPSATAAEALQRYLAVADDATLERFTRFAIDESAQWARSRGELRRRSIVS